MQYRIIKAVYADQLDDAVHDAINRGWQPIGGVCVTEGYVDDARFFQAMVKPNQSLK